MAQHVVSAAGPPTEAPPSIGAHYIDTNNGDIYLGNGVASERDRLLGGGAGSTGGRIYRQIFKDDNNLGVVQFSDDGGSSWSFTDQSPDEVGIDDMNGNGDIHTLGDVLMVNTDF